MSSIRDVFISSIQRDYSEVRAGAKRAVEALGKRPVMAEQGSDSSSPQRSLLGEVAGADALVLILGPRYGDRGESGVSPTEEEYEEALRHGIPTVVLVHECEHDEDQADFIRRIGGTWEHGKRYSKFSGTDDIQAMVVEGLRRLDEAPATADLIAAAAARIIALTGDGRPSGHGTELALIAAPAIDSPILTAAQLQDTDTLQGLIRRARDLAIFVESEGVQSDVSRAGIELQSHLNGPPRIAVHVDGVIKVILRTCDLNAHHVGSVIDPSVLEPSLGAALEYVVATWQLLDLRGDVRQSAVAVSMHGIDNVNFGPPPTGNTISFPGFGRIPSRLVAPESPLVVPAERIADQETLSALIAEIRMPFAEVGALT